MVIARWPPPLIVKAKGRRGPELADDGWLCCVGHLGRGGGGSGDDEVVKPWVVLSTACHVQIAPLMRQVRVHVPHAQGMVNLVRPFFVGGFAAFTEASAVDILSSPPAVARYM